MPSAVLLESSVFLWVISLQHVNCGEGSDQASISTNFTLYILGFAVYFHLKKLFCIKCLWEKRIQMGLGTCQWISRKDWFLLIIDQSFQHDFCDSSGLNYIKMWLLLYLYYWFIFKYDLLYHSILNARDQGRNYISVKGILINTFYEKRIFWEEEYWCIWP